MNVRQVRLPFVKGVYNENWKKLRVDRHYTIKEIEEKLNIVSTTISKIENGTILPTIEQINAYHSFFNASIDYLVGLTSVSNFEVSEISKYTGLSPQAIGYLHDDYREAPESMDFINSFLIAENIDFIAEEIVSLKRTFVSKAYYDMIFKILPEIIDYKGAVLNKIDFLQKLYEKLSVETDLYYPLVNSSNLKDLKDDYISEDELLTMIAGALSQDEINIRLEKLVAKYNVRLKHIVKTMKSEVLKRYECEAFALSTMINKTIDHIAGDRDIFENEQLIPVFEKYTKAIISEINSKNDKQSKPFVDFTNDKLNEAIKKYSKRSVAYSKFLNKLDKM